MQSYLHASRGLPTATTHFLFLNHFLFRTHLQLLECRVCQFSCWVRSELLLLSICRRPLPHFLVLCWILSFCSMFVFAWIPALFWICWYFLRPPAHAAEERLCCPESLALQWKTVSQSFQVFMIIIKMSSFSKQRLIFLLYLSPSASKQHLKNSIRTPF